MDKKFRTKSGFCHVTEDQIILTRDGVIGNVSNFVAGNDILKMTLIYMAFSVGLIYISYRDFITRDVFGGILFGVVGLYLLFGSFKSLNYSGAPIIERKNIIRTKFVRGTLGLTRARFVIEFIDGKKFKTRLILLPGSLSGGQYEAHKAITIMKEENLIR